MLKKAKLANENFERKNKREARMFAEKKKLMRALRSHNIL
jgi:hypothetical protein